METFALVDYTNRSNWQANYTSMKALWEKFLQGIKPLDGSQCDVTPLANPSGPYVLFIRLEQLKPIIADEERLAATAMY